MNEKSSLERPAETLSRRSFLSTVAGGALALGAGTLGAGQLLAGCGGGGSGGGGSSNNGAPFTMFISTFLARSVLKFDSASGSLTELIKLPEVSPEGKKPQTTAGVVVSPNKQNLFVFSPGSDQILMLDAATGAIVRRITGPFLTTGHDGAIGPDGLLYFVNAPSLNAAGGAGNNQDSIERLDPATGDHIGTFIAVADHPEVRGPFGIIWGPDGDLYVSSVLAYGFNPNDFPFRSDHISRFDGQSGAFKGFVARAEHLAFTLSFHPNGRLLVPSHFFGRIYDYNTATGAREDAFVDIPFPIGQAFGPNGDYYAASFSDQDHIDKLIDTDTSNDDAAQGAGRILRFDRNTGKPKGTVVSNLPYAGFISFL